MFIDTHAHLEMEDFASDRQAVLDRAREAGVNFILTVGTDEVSGEKAVCLAEGYDFIFAAVGIHPHEAKKVGRKTYDHLKKLAKSKKVLAWGEIGLDFFRNLSPPDKQREVFVNQLEIASEMKLPVIIHDREAHREIIAILATRKGKITGVIHCFSGDERMAARLIDMGFYISLPGTVTFAKADGVRRVAKYLPLDRLLLETDAPYLAPEPHRGKRNEPAYVVLTARKIAEIKNRTVEELGEITTKNACSLFGFPFNFS